MEAFLEKFQHLKHFNLEEIKSITGGFDNSKVIGEGGFGKVYEGVLSDSNGKTMVAFKRLSSNCGQGNPEFLKEIFMLSRYTHENLISLLGFCDKDGEKILVYEHASHGSLDRHLSSVTLTWTQRLKICLGAARGLCYLHDPKETRERVIHRDIKSSNILIDENWNAKVSDMGLSKIGPANQAQSFMATNVVGTFWYVDPMYMETNILTKESDVYSFGVVLFEVLCGSLCFENKNNHFQSLVRRWKKSYKEKKLNEIIFHNLKQDVDRRSLETFSEIAYQCLQKSRAERPKMSHVVEKLEIALGFDEMAKRPKTVFSKEDLSKGILVNEGKTWLSLNKNGEHCEMISAECFYASSSSSYGDYRPFSDEIKSRFEVRNRKQYLYSSFETHVRTQFLSPGITYTVNLVFKLRGKSTDFISLYYSLAGEKEVSVSYLIQERGDGWLMADQLFHFICDTTNVDLDLKFSGEPAMEVEGIEVQSLERVQHEVVLENEEVDTQTDTYWEQKLPGDYEEIIKGSKDSVQWTTKKELYSILCKGFPINDGEEWFSFAKNGKRCHMLSARRALYYPPDQDWDWQSLPDSRFEQAAFVGDDDFWIRCISNMLSPETTYAICLVYKLPENHSGFDLPVKVSSSFGQEGIKAYGLLYVYLLSPQAQVIRGKVYRKKRVPQQRNDGWMEVSVCEFQTGTTTKTISPMFQIKPSDNMSLKGLIVLGMEFKPI